MASSARTPKYFEFYYKLYAGHIERIEMDIMNKAFNNANSRFYRKAQKDVSLGDPVEYAKKKREEGYTLLEAMNEIAWGWQSQNPGGPRRVPPGGIQKILAEEYGIEFDAKKIDEEAQKKALEQEKLEAIKPGGFYYLQFGWLKMMA